jgi:hypothetical protein
MKPSCILALALLSPGLLVAADPAPKPLSAPTPVAVKAESYELPGTFRPDDTLATLQARFGAAQVKVDQLDGAEGETVPGVVIFGADPARRLEVFMRDMDKRKGIDTLRVGGKSSRWHIDNGMHLGMTLDELVKLNGKPIKFSGMGWDYGGGVLDWNGGKLAPPDNAPVFRNVSLTTADDAKDQDYPSGDAEFRSDDKKYPRQGQAIYVGELRVSFSQPGE